MSSEQLPQPESSHRLLDELDQFYQAKAAVTEAGQITQAEAGEPKSVPDALRAADEAGSLAGSAEILHGIRDILLRHRPNPNK